MMKSEYKRKRLEGEWVVDLVWDKKRINSKENNCHGNLITDLSNALNPDKTIIIEMQSSVNRHLLFDEVSMNTQLKDCPFCGKEAKSYLQTYDTPFSEPYCYMQIGCMSCGIFFSTHHFRIVDKPHIPDEEVQECINAWNNRVI